MEHDAELAAAILDRSIAQHEQRLSNAQASDNARLASRVQRDLDRLLEQKRRMTAEPVEGASRGGQSKRLAKGSRPLLRDDGAVVDPHGERWMELVGHIENLNEHLPNEYLSDRCGLFSTEREFARYIREIESRIGDKD